MVTYVKFNAGGLIDGWDSAVINMIDFPATTQKIENILQEMFPHATIVVVWEDGNDMVYGEWEQSSDEDDARQELIDFPWYDFEHWGVSL